MSAPIRAGSTLGKYEITAELGAGGAGSVFVAVEKESGKQVALKTLMTNTLEVEEVHSRFIREISVAQKLGHPNVVAYDDCGFEGNWLFYTMEHVPWGSLADVLRRKRCLPWRDAVECAIQLSHGLHHLHENGIVHRDLKPANIFLSDDGKLKIGDFGLARDLDSGRLTAQGLTVGTGKYLSPEQARGEDEIDGRVDLYALGCVLFEMLAGRTPFEDSGDYSHNTFAEMLKRHVEKKPPKVTSFAFTCPKPLEEFVDECLAKDPDDRPASGKVAAESLAQILADEPVDEPANEADSGSEESEAPAENLTERLTKGKGQENEINWTAVAVIGIVAIVLLVVASQFAGG